MFGKRKDTSFIQDTISPPKKTSESNVCFEGISYRDNEYPNIKSKPYISLHHPFYYRLIAHSDLKDESLNISASIAQTDPKTLQIPEDQAFKEGKTQI